MVTFDDFKKLDLRVARVLEVKEHPEADRLYVLKVLVADEEKQIVAGIRHFYTVDELTGRNIVIVNNLEPVILRGEVSNGMLLAAKSDNGAPVLIVPEKDVSPGSVIG